jgi:LysR family nitrogen assimilation transcriptional regulator
METRRLGYFVRVAEDGSLTKAAQILRIAQPALTRQMRLLEADVGVTLFRRTARGMTLTEDGERLRAAVEGPLRELELALHGFRASSSPVVADAVLGMPASLSEILARPLALTIARDFPAVRLRIVEAPMGSLQEWLTRGMVDFALTEESSQDERVIDQRIGTLPLELVGPPDSPLPPGEPVSFAEAARLPLILTSHHMGVRGAINEAAQHSQARLNIRLEADAPRLARELVEEGLGYAVLPRRYCGDAIDSGRVQAWPLIDPVLEVAIFLAVRRTSQVARKRLAGVESLILAQAKALLTPPLALGDEPR